jgi:hypothetical protein
MKNSQQLWQESSARSRRAAYRDRRSQANSIASECLAARQYAGGNGFTNSRCSLRAEHSRRIMG